MNRLLASLIITGGKDFVDAVFANREIYNPELVEALEAMIGAVPVEFSEDELQARLLESARAVLAGAPTK